MIVDSSMMMKPTFKEVVVSVPEFGEGAEIRLREMDAVAVAEFNDLIKRNRLLDNKRLPVFFASIITLCAIDEKGNKISSISDADKIANQWSYDLILRVGNAASELNGFMGEGVTEIKKDSGKTQEAELSGE